MSALPLESASRELGVSSATLRRWLRDGAPVARRGRRGRGCRTLVDPAAVQGWRAVQQADSGAVEAVLRDLAGRLPELLGEAISEAFRAVPSKRDPAGLAWLGCAAWSLATDAVLDAIRIRLPGLPELGVAPETIERLRKIAVR